MTMPDDEKAAVTVPDDETAPDNDDRADIEQRKQQILLRAEALANSPEYIRSPLVMQLICDAKAFGLCTEAEIFQHAYGDPSGRMYWDARLSEPTPLNLLADLLCVHHDKNFRDIDYAKIAILRAFRDAAQAGETWFLGNTAPLLDMRDGCGPLEGLDEVKIRPRDAVVWMLSKPMRRDFVPAGLQALLETGHQNNAAIENIEASGLGTDQSNALVENVEVSRTGAPGRPSSMHLVQEEASRRREGGSALRSVVEEAEELKKWFDANHRGKPNLTAKTIENNIRPDHRAWADRDPRN